MVACPQPQDVQVLALYLVYAGEQGVEVVAFVAQGGNEESGVVGGVGQSAWSHGDECACSQS